MGITGTKKPSLSLLKKSVLEIKKNTKLPILVGFGINNSNQVKEINKFADGCVIGSAIINLIEESNKEKYSIERILSKIKLFLSKLKKVIEVLNELDNKFCKAQTAGNSRKKRSSRQFVGNMSKMFADAFEKRTRK